MLMTGHWLPLPSNVGQKEKFSISFPSIPFLSISTPTCKQMGGSNAHIRDIPSPTQLFLRMAASHSFLCLSFLPADLTNGKEMGSAFWQVRIRFQASGCAVVQAKYGDSHRDLESHERASTEETAFLPWTKMAQMSLDSIPLPQPRSLASWTLAQILNAGNWAPVSSGTRTALALKYAQLSFPVRMKASGSRYLQTLSTSPQLALHLAYLLLIFGLGY